MNLMLQSVRRDYYGVRLFVYLLILLLFLSFTVSHLVQHYFSNTFFASPFSKETVYFLSSDTLKEVYERNGMDYSGYQTRLETIEETCDSLGYSTESVDASELADLPTESILFALDMLALSDDEIADIEKFVHNGGRLLYNFTAGFIDGDTEYRGEKLITTISGLRLNQTYNSLSFNENTSGYVSTRMLSPLTGYLKEGRGLGLTLYDPLPIYTTPKELHPDAYLTNWPQNMYVNIDEKHYMAPENSGLIWHGYYGKGKWVYISFPSYLFVEAEKAYFDKLIHGILTYLGHTFVVRQYPYLDRENVIFVSEDTEFKFENLKQFNALSLKYNFPVTAFCVASLAEKNPQAMQDASQNPNLEIGSHSYSHQKIVGESPEVYKKETQGSKTVLAAFLKGTPKGVTGFRPPREELDSKMIALLKEAGFHYVMNQNENRLYPYNAEGMMIIPRHGTDDYTYLINLDWDTQSILDQMILESRLTVSLDGIYTLSTHTHLMTFGSNIGILDRFFAYVLSQPDMHPLNGEELYKRLRLLENISYSYDTTQKNIVLKVQNKNSEAVKDYTLRLYVPPQYSITSAMGEMSSLNVAVKKVRDNEFALRIDSLPPQSQNVVFINYE
jgi:hypothetical protein